LKRIHHQGMLIKHLALTGGEPLLHPDETMDFFKTAKALYPKVFTRLYTCGDLINRDILKRLKNTKLDEIRFSLRAEDSPEETSNILQKIQLAKEYIPKVMVEMPVIPGNYDLMENFLRELDTIGIFGINLLEFCFPFNNAEEFRKRTLKIKNPPHHILYNYWYGGGLPVAESEKDCLELLEFALEEKLKIGVHYCSLENKHTAQIFEQNKKAKLPPHLYMSNKDYFLKSAKVFGDDRQKVLQIFNNIGYQDYIINEGHENIEFHVGKIKYLKGLDIEIGIVTGIMEEREDGLYFRELKIDLAYPQNFEKIRNGDTPYNVLPH